ncbi:MAG: Calx-beta domain-containing protein [Chloroflexota bacterium]
MRVLALQKTKRTIGLIGLLIIGWLLAGGTAVFASTPLEAGFFDFTYPSGTGGNGSTTAEKPESKLWHHDGFWWGVMWSTSTNAYTIHKLDWATQNWSNTGVQVDDRKASLADALSDGNTLYIVSHVWTTSGATAGAGDRGKLYRYSYSGGGYTLDSGYPIEINEAKTEALTITKDSTGMLWSTWVENAQVMVAHSNASGGGDSDWTTPYLLPVTGNDVKSDDLSSMVAFDGYVGVMWSRQKSGIDMHFAAHKDGTADDVWTSTIPYSTSGDDHMNLKSLQADDAGRLFAIVKTSLNAKLIQLLVCDTSATACTNANDWTATQVWDSTYVPTRPIMLIDTSNREIYIFARIRSGDVSLGDDIFYKKTSLDDIKFDIAELGEPFVSSSTYLSINNPTSTKQNVDASTGMVVLATDDRAKAYVHGCMDLGGSSPLCPSTSAAPTVRFAAAAPQVDEGAATAVITVELSKAAANPVSVQYASSNGTASAGSDYTAVSGTLNFGVGETSKTFNVPITNDTVSEPSETVNLTLSNATSVGLGTPATAVLTILDNDQPTVQLSSSTTSVDETAGTTSFNVTLSHTTYQPVTVDLASADGTASAGSDYTAISQTVTIPAGQTSYLVTVTVADDSWYEGAETAVFTLTNPTGATLGTPASLTLTINDDETAPTVSFIGNSTSVAENGGSLDVEVQLSATTQHTVTVNIASSNDTATAGSDYTAISQTLTFAPGATSQMVTVAISDDVAEEGNEAFQLTLSNASPIALGNDPVLSVVILDDDVPPTVQLQAATASASEGDGTLLLTVLLEGLTDKTVSVDVATVDETATAGSDYEPISTTLTFTPGIHSQQVAITLLDDALDEPDETLTVQLSNLVNADAGAPLQTVVTIADDDDAPTVQFDGDAFAADEGDGTAVITLTLSAPSAKSVAVDVATVDETAVSPDDYTAISSTITFAPGETSQQVTVALTDDGLDEPDETVGLTLSAPQNGALGSPATATLTIADNDEPPTVQFAAAEVTVLETEETAVFSLTLSTPSSLPVEVKVSSSGGSATPGADYGAINQKVTFAPGETTQTVALTLFDDALVEGGETVLLQLSQFANATAGDPAAATLTIADDETPLVAWSVGETAVSERAGTLSLTINLSFPAPIPLTVKYATVDGTATSGSDYSAASGTVAFAVGESSKTITIHLLDDDDNENPETFQVQLSDVLGGSLGSPAVITVTITDDESTGWTLYLPIIRKP